MKERLNELINKLNELHGILDYADYCSMIDIANELSTAIEDGRLVKLPCVMQSPYKGDKEVWFVYLAQNNAIVCEPHFTKEQAEARLKELQEGKE